MAPDDFWAMSFLSIDRPVHTCEAPAHTIETCRPIGENQGHSEVGEDRRDRCLASSPAAQAQPCKPCVTDAFEHYLAIPLLAFAASLPEE